MFVSSPFRWVAIYRTCSNASNITPNSQCLCQTQVIRIKSVNLGHMYSLYFLSVLNREWQQDRICLKMTMVKLDKMNNNSLLQVVFL